MTTSNAIKYPYKLAVQDTGIHYAGPSIWVVKYRCFSSAGKTWTAYVVNADNERHAAMRVAAQRHKTGPWIEVVSVEQIHAPTHWTERIERLIHEDIHRGAEPAATSVTDSENSENDSAASPELLPTQLPKEK